MNARTITMLLALALAAHVHGQEWEWLDEVHANGGFDSGVTVVEYECVTEWHSCHLAHEDHEVLYGIDAYGRLIFQVDHYYSGGKRWCGGGTGDACEGWPYGEGLQGRVSSWNCRRVGIDRQMQCERETHWDRWGIDETEGPRFEPNKVTQVYAYEDHHNRVRVRYAGPLFAAKNLVSVAYQCHDTAGCGQVEGYDIPHCEAAYDCGLLAATKQADGRWHWHGLAAIDDAEEPLYADLPPRLDSGSTQSISAIGGYRRFGTQDSISCRVANFACPDWFYKTGGDDG